MNEHRGWVIDQGWDEELFEQLTDRLISAFSVDTTQQRIDAGVVRRFVEREGECFGFGKPSETKRQLPEVAQVLADLVIRYQDTSAAELESYSFAAQDTPAGQVAASADGNNRLPASPSILISMSPP